MSGRDDQKRRKDKDRERGFGGDRSDRNRDRDRDRRREREHRSSTSDANPIQGPIVLLKRPTASGQSQPSQSQSTRDSHNKDHEQKETKDFEYKCEKSDTNFESERPTPVVLLRPDKTKTKNDDKLKKDSKPLEKVKPSEPINPIEMLRPYCGMQNKGAVTFIDRKMKIQPISFLNYWTRPGKYTTEFLVITVVGKPLTGKSTILSHLASDKGFGISKIFEERSRKQELESSLYITSDNVIFIEMASLFNCAATYDLPSQQGTLESMSLTWNLRLMRFAFSISHVVLIVTDNLLDPNVCQLINSAEMIRPMESTLGEGIYPEIVYVCNKVSQGTLNDDKLLSKYRLAFSTVAGRTPLIRPNVFMLPQIRMNDEDTVSNYSFEELKASIREFIRYNCSTFLECSEFPKNPQKISAFDWYSNSIKLWESMDHPNYFASYVKLFP